MLSSKEQSIHQKLCIQRSLSIVDANRAIELNDKNRYEKAEAQYRNIQAIMRSDFTETDALIIKEANIDVSFPEWPRTDADDVVELLDINGEVSVPEAEVIALCANLEMLRQNAIGVAEYANEIHDYGLYLNKEAEVRDIDRLLRLSMFRVYKPDMSKKEPEWVSRPEDDMPFLVSFNDESNLDDTVDVPF